jgi:hypothetical protein
MIEATVAPNQRSFSLNSREFYEAVTPPPDPWGWGPRLPREPMTRQLTSTFAREQHVL